MKILYTSLLLALSMTGALNSVAQVPVYSSYSSAAPVIFLDFDGHTLNGTSWNSSGPIVCAPSGLTTAQVTEVYNRISEDYRPFQINVTTDSTKYWQAPSKKRMRVIFTITNEWYGNNAGGVAYTGSFTWGDNTPCFVFSKLLSYSAKKCAEAGAHEAGHTLGLRHQASYDANCNLVSSYNYGVGSGDISWAPIMGVGYNRNFTTWHNGPNPFGCANNQPDISVITNSTNGIVLRSDDYTESFATASSMTFTNNTSKIDGTITSNTDKDLFTFTLNTSRRIKLNALPASVGSGDNGSNLDLMVQLYDQSKTEINTYNPAQALSVSIDTTLNPGTYYVLVDATGNQYASDYGSLGAYALEVEEIPTYVLPVQKLQMNGVVENGFHKMAWDVVSEERIVKQMLEFSHNGKDFTPLAADVDLSSNQYQYHPEKVGTIYYRLQVTLENKQQFYTNVVALRSNGNASRPRLVSNLIRGNELFVSSPAAYTYSVNDYNGRTVSKGQVTEGSSTIITNYLPAGTYLIRFMKGSDQYVEKFMKQ
ncbi:MAG TPA: zinc-dependent metalloprotease [Chitinophagaceae bacterium]|nr:zinc-dependent metalloprotease [Chitinophagaceae bacterium]